MCFYPEMFCPFSCTHSDLFAKLNGSKLNDRKSPILEMFYTEIVSVITNLDVVDTYMYLVFLRNLNPFEQTPTKERVANKFWKS